jgi:hypothetical protein
MAAALRRGAAALRTASGAEAGLASAIEALAAARDGARAAAAVEAADADALEAPQRRALRRLEASWRAVHRPSVAALVRVRAMSLRGRRAARERRRQAKRRRARESAQRAANAAAAAAAAASGSRRAAEADAGVRKKGRVRFKTLAEVKIFARQQRLSAGRKSATSRQSMVAHI